MRLLSAATAVRRWSSSMGRLSYAPATVRRSARISAAMKTCTAASLKSATASMKAASTAMNTGSCYAANAECESDG
jgi:hypothetical protein